MRPLFQDFRFGLRLFQRDPGFTAVAVLTLALGIAVNTTVFSWIDGVLLRPYPGAADGHELAVLEMTTIGAPNGANTTSYLDYRDYRRNLRSLSGLAVHREDVFSIGEAEETQARWGEMVSGNYFDVLRVKPAAGRMFTPQEDGDELGAWPVAVISHRLWREHFHEQRDAVGRKLRVNQRDLTVVGVAPPEFRGTMPGLAFDIWIPVTMAKDLGVLDESAFRNRGSRGLYAVARLAPGVGVRQARAEASSFARNLEATFPGTNTGVSATILPVWEFHGAGPDVLLKPLQILMAVALLLLLIVCANVANLLLARSVARRKEFGIRLALGAGGFRLGRQVLTETLLLAGCGAVLGIALSPWAGELLPALVPNINAPVAIGFALNGRVLAFTIAVCLAAALLAGLLPALFWLRSDVNDSLREGGRSGTDGIHSHRMRGLLVTAEVALACLALTGAGVFLRTFQHARNIDPGFETKNMVLARFYLAGSGFSTPVLQQFCVRLRDRLRSVPGIEEVSYADYAPLGSSAGPYEALEVNGYVPDRREPMNVNRYVVGTGYFSTLRVQLLEGRDFLESDDKDSPPVIIVNETFAKRYIGGRSAVGWKVRFGKRVATVIGVAHDSKYFNVTEAPRPHFFAAYRQRGRAGQQLYFFVRTAGKPGAIMAALRREVAAVDPKAGAMDVMALSEWTGVTLLSQKITASLAAALGLISLVLAAIGLYSVMAYAVTQRTREIGIRMALGARPGNVLGDILVRGMAMTVMGLIAGMAAAFVVMRLIGAMLVGVSPTDPASFAAAALFLIGIGLLASYVPARRATRVDPVTALRCD